MGNSLKGGEIHQKYEFKEALGSGSFAVVKRAIRKADKAEFAIKCIKKAKLNQEELSVVHDEVDIMHKIKHENCIQLFEMYESKKKVYMVIELLAGGELFDRIVSMGSFSEKEAAELMKALAGAIKYLHGIGIVHRDLKPENLLYANATEKSPIKITDFGLAKLKPDANAENKKMNTACGTPGYVAPEVLCNTPYGPAVDLWSLGVILYILLCGFPPFYHESTSALYKQIKRGQYDFPSPYWDAVSDSAKNLIAGLLTVDPKKRLTPQGILDHPWVSGGKASAKAIGGGHANRMKLLQARATLRRSVRTIIAMQRFSSALSKTFKSKVEGKVN